MALAKKSVIARRRMSKGYWEFGERLDEEEARDLFDQIDDLREIESISEANHRGALLTELFGEEWWHLVDDKAVEPNPDWHYLCRVIAAVHQALRQKQQQVTA